LLIEPENRDVSVREQCDLVGINRSSYYYKPRLEKLGRDKALKDLIDVRFTKAPVSGVKSLVKYLRRLGHQVGKKLIRRLMREMGLMPIYPKPRLSLGNKQHKIYPYLLKGLNIVRANHVWCADITYIRLLKGFAYLVAIMDWATRYVLSWRLSNSLDTGFCVECLKEALKFGKPQIFNTDQGSQFTSIEFTDVLKDQGITISMDGRGRVFDNIFIERLWRTVKYENVYIQEYRFIPEAQQGLKTYFEFYNTDRPHSSLEDRTPWEAYTGLESPIVLPKNQIALTP
jgi:putative transposase